MFDFNIIATLISPIIVVACLCLGYVIKHGVQNKMLNAFIPCLLAITGAAANVWYSGIVDLPTIVAGMVSGLAATGLYEGFTNILNLPKLDELAGIDIKYGEPKGDHFA